MKLILILSLFSTVVFAQPHMKGDDLYSWKDSKGIIHFALLEGTNVQKDSASLQSNKLSLKELEQKLMALSSNSNVHWNNKVMVSDSTKLKFALPSKEIIAQLMALAKRQQIVLQIASSPTK